MSKSADGVDRRDFMFLAAAAGAGLVAGAAPAAAQEPAAPAGAGTGTVYTGDVVQGKKVISALDVADLEPGRHHFFFEGVQMVSGKAWYVSIVVVKGAKPGKRVLLTSGVHGDEISPMHTIHLVLDQLDPASMSGAVVAVTDISSPAIEAMARRWPNSGRGIDLVDMNREWPGNPNGATAAARHAAALFERVFRANADFGIDFHTAATGMDMTAFHLARMDLPEVKAMVDLYPVEQVFDDPAYPTLLANALIDVGIPSFTPEVGKSRSLEPERIAMFVEGTMNVLKHHGIVEGAIGRTAADAGTFVASTTAAILTTHGGFVELLADLNEEVTEGQLVARQRNTFGEEVASYASPVAGKVAARRTDATAEPGTPLMFFLVKAPEHAIDPSFSE